MKEQLEQFLDNRDRYVICTADIIYTAYMKPEAEDEVEKKHPLSEEELEMAKEIEKASPSQLVKMMRKSLPSHVQMILRKKLLEFDDEVFQEIAERIISSRQEVFANHAAYYLLRSEADARKWIIDNYGEVKSENMKSLLCMVIGVKGNPTDVPFLMDEARRFERDFPDESYSQGPVIALEHLEDRWNKGDFPDFV